MTSSLKQAAKSVIRSPIRLLARTTMGRKLNNQAIQAIVENQFTVRHRDITLQFSVPNPTCHWRATTFSKKEPDTLKWIEAIPAGALLWDIGANVGLYSVYAAKRNVRVVAFEPSVFNLEWLARNIVLNQVVDQVSIFPLPLSGGLGVQEFVMGSTIWGGALSQFGNPKKEASAGPAKPSFRYAVAGVSMDDAVERLGVPRPDYIKLDVDGIESVILRNGANALKQVTSMLIEVDSGAASEFQPTADFLGQLGLVKRPSDREALTPGLHTSENQIWVRTPGSSPAA